MKIISIRSIHGTFIGFITKKNATRLYEKKQQQQNKKKLINEDKTSNRGCKRPEMDHFHNWRCNIIRLNLC